MGWQGESLELISGQSFMFINKDEFIVQLKVIKEHFDRQDEVHPLRSLLYDFTVTFIDNYRHLMYQDENKVFQTQSSSIGICIANILEFRQVL